ncbi:MAG TPA: hypothetical protein VKW06_00540 [Candidatus Angelobacter sp.]|nr:hypothetical protein [Candidatus Angelobacter sp.]
MALLTTIKSNTPSAILAMKKAVVDLVKQFEVRWPVIGAVMVLVVYMLIGCKLPAQHLLHDQAMLHREPPSAVIPDHDVAIEDISGTLIGYRSSVSSLNAHVVLASARQIAELSRPSFLPADDGRAALDTAKTKWHDERVTQLENWLHRQVCAKAMSLAEAQKAISGNWYAAYRKMLAAQGVKR